VFDGQPRQQSKLGDSSLARIELRKPCQGVIQLNKIQAGILSAWLGSQCHAPPIGTALLCGLASGVIGQELPHGQGRSVVEMCVVRPFGCALVGKSQVSLMDQRSGLQCVIRLLPSQKALSQRPQFCVDGGEQSVRAH
jgi:hypothetical protein